MATGIRMCWPGQVTGACGGEVRLRTGLKGQKAVMCKKHWAFYRTEF